MQLKEAVHTAARNIKRYSRVTPLDFSFFLSEKAGCNIFLKLESMQHTGSFKFRGAINKMLSFNDERRSRGVIAASTGNHGLAVAYAARLLGMKSIICLPENSLTKKIEMLRKYDVELIFHGDNCVIAEQFARKVSEERGMSFISPYNDEDIIAGQGTIGFELQGQLDSVECVYAAVGGGGLIGGIAAYLKAADDAVNIVGCQPRHSAVMYESIRAGHVVAVDEKPTLSDGTAGGIEEDSITYPLCERYVDSWVLVDEREIKRAMKLIFEEHRLVIEGASGVAVAALLHQIDTLSFPKGANVVVIICGGNIDIDSFKKIAW